MKRPVISLLLLIGSMGTGVVEAADTATSVSAGRLYTCAVISGGAALCWGLNDYGQLGDGTTTRRLTPTLVSGLWSGVAAIAEGANHTCALTTGGGVLCHRPGSSCLQGSSRQGA